MTKKCPQRKCSPQKIPIDVEISPQIELCIDKPRIKVKNHARCKCKHKHHKKHKKKHRKKHRRKHKSSSSSSSSSSSYDDSSCDGDHMF